MLFVLKYESKIVNNNVKRNAGERKKQPGVMLNGKTAFT